MDERQKVKQMGTNKEVVDLMWYCSPKLRVEEVGTSTRQDKVFATCNKGAGDSQSCTYGARFGTFKQ
jgi:hypothetical protein